MFVYKGKSVQNKIIADTDHIYELMEKVDYRKKIRFVVLFIIYISIAIVLFITSLVGRLYQD